MALEYGSIFLSACSGEDSIQFPELSGPGTTTLLPAPGDNLSDLAAFDMDTGGENALALVVKDSEASWFGLVSGLRRIGIPFSVVDNITDGLSHDVVMIYPALTGANSTPQELRQIASHVRAGGTVLAFSVIGGGMPDLFGFSESMETPLLHKVTFQDDEFNRVFASSTAESRINLGNPDLPGAGLSGIRYLGTKHAPVATFGDGSAAITHNFFQGPERTGHAYALGLDLGHFIARANNGRFDNLAGTYVNSYQPQVDTFLRFLKAVYQQGEPDAVLFSPAPRASELSVLLTHDIDFTVSIHNTVDYAALETSLDIRATYFIQTKYVTDYNDKLFLTPETVPLLNNLVDAGMEIASHSVSHSNEFRNMPNGSGDERYPDYEPFVQDFGTVRNASIFGELRVSKFLLDSLTGENGVSFRPGHLSLPETLPQLLDASGYRFSSAMTANQALSHLPYQTMVDRDYDHLAPI